MNIWRNQPLPPRSSVCHAILAGKAPFSKTPLLRARHVFSCLQPIELARHHEEAGPSIALSTRRYPFCMAKRGTKRVLECARLAMGFADVRAGSRVRMLVLVQARCWPPAASTPRRRRPRTSGPPSRPAFPQFRTRITACYTLIEWMQALVAYQDCHILVLALAGLSSRRRR